MTPIEIPNHGLSSDSAMSLVEALTFVVCGIDVAGRIAIANQNCAKLTELPLDALIGQEFCALFARHAPQEVAAMWTALPTTQQPAEYIGLCRNGRRVRWLFSAWQHKPAGGVCAVGEDVTRVSAERAQMRMRDRVSALRNLGSGLAHELRNPLNSASLQLSVLSRKLSKTPDGHPFLQHADAVAREIGRAAALLNDFLMYVRPPSHNPQRASVSAVIASAVASVQERANELGVQLRCELGDAVIVELDAERVKMALQNLLQNALDATQAVTSPQVHVGWCVRAHEVAIEIGDNGVGLLSPDAPIFDPFFTTKPDGTGLGLSIVERVAIDHGGTIEAKRRGDTTVFTLRLPIATGSYAAPGQ